ncbi:hypothetical protein FGD77_14890 [Roseovarius sp. M141]|nr:hypothetical protein [Roseovarius sp. M141]
MMIALGACLLVVAGLAAFLLRPSGPSAAELAEIYAAPLPPPEGPLAVYHLGHSLVGRDMPAMLAQLAPDGHRYDSQLGWGTSLREHWEPDLPINGFDVENAHPRYRDAREAVASGDYDAIVLTEMVEIKDALRYHDGAAYLGRWADLARSAVAAPPVYLYETWHPLDDPAGWLERLDADLRGAWIGQLIAPNLRAEAPINLIPAGQVMAALVRAVEGAGGVGPMTDRTDLFSLNADGTQDQIHPNDLGNYLIALTHYAVLYHRSPVGLPHDLLRADGTRADLPGAELALLMQQTVWQVVRALPETGVAP